MQDRQKVFFISAIVLLALLALVEGVVLLRHSPRWHDWITSGSKTFRSLAGSLKTSPSQTDSALTDKDDIILHETAEDFERLQNQINRLFYEMTGDTPFRRRNLRAMNPAYDSRFPFENVRRLQSEIERIFQMARESRHTGVLNLIERDWGDVGEISSVNMDEDGTNYVVTISMPGFERNNINVSLNGRLLIIEAGAERQRATQSSQAVSSGCFKTQIMLPNDIAGESAQASYENSILKIMIPKKPASNSLARKVTIM